MYAALCTLIISYLKPVPSICLFRVLKRQKYLELASGMIQHQTLTDSVVLRHFQIKQEASSATAEELHNTLRQLKYGRFLTELLKTEFTI